MKKIKTDEQKLDMTSILIVTLYKGKLNYFKLKKNLFELLKIEH